jgi:hypothetical protein
MRAAPIALITGLLPLFCIHITYFIAASHGHVDWCNPYWDSCTSISATGRQLPEKLVFKFIMIPAGLLAILFWWLVQQWLWQVHQRRSGAMQWLGSIAGLFLILYVVALGEGRDYQQVRRTGIVLFFSLTFLAQLLFLYQLGRAGERVTPLQRNIFGWQKAMAATLLGIGITTVILDLTYSDYDSIEDAFEWVMMLFIVAQFCSHYWLWRESDVRVEVNAARKKSASPE